MTELLNGDGTVPASTSGWVQHVISSSTNASPIAVTFCSPTCFNEGDTIEIEGHLVNTAANGSWRVHVTGANTVTLPGSTGNGVGGLTGYAIDYSVNPLLQVADDGDGANASNLNTAYEGILNFVPYLYKRAGKYSLYDRQVIASAGGTLASFGTPFGSATSLTSATWTKITGTDGNVYPNAIKSGDILVIELDCVDGSIATNAFSVSIGVSINGGANFITGHFDGVNQPHVFVGGSSEAIHAKYSGPINNASMPIKAGGLSFCAMGMQSTGAPVNITLNQPYQFVVTHYRSNA